MCSGFLLLCTICRGGLIKAIRDSRLRVTSKHHEPAGDFSAGCGRLGPGELHETGVARRQGRRRHYQHFHQDDSQARAVTLFLLPSLIRISRRLLDWLVQLSRPDTRW